MRNLDEDYPILDICEIRDFKDLGILKEEYDFLL